MDPTDAARSSGSFLTPLLFSLAGIVATSLALVAYHLILVKYCVRNRYDQEDENGRNPSIPTHDQIGGFASEVEHKNPETIPILSFSSQRVKGNQTECVVCLGELEEEDKVRLLPNCRQVFHVQCIDNWFMAHSSCPVCRTPVVVATELDVVRATPLATGDDGSDSVERFQDLAQSSEQERQLQAASNSAGVQSNTNTLLRHCVPLVFPRETKPKHLAAELKRSLYIDHSYSYIIINLADHDHDHSGKASSSNSWSTSSKMILTKSNSFKVQSMRQLDRVSSSLLRSFSQLQIERTSNTCGILPY